MAHSRHGRRVRFLLADAIEALPSRADRSDGAAVHLYCQPSPGTRAGVFDEWARCSRRRTRAFTPIPSSGDRPLMQRRDRDPLLDRLTSSSCPWARMSDSSVPLALRASRVPMTATENMAAVAEVAGSPHAPRPAGGPPPLRDYRGRVHTFDGRPSVPGGRPACRASRLSLFVYSLSERPMCFSEASRPLCF